MSWANTYVRELLSGRTVSFRPYGSSMEPHIKSGQLVTVEPREPDAIKKGDIVLCRVSGRQYLHFVSHAHGVGERRLFTIANASGRVNGTTSVVYGVLVKVEE